MKYIFGIVSILFFPTLIKSRGVPQIQIYEIREKGDNNLELRDIESLPDNQNRVESQLLRLLRPRKQIRKGEVTAQALIEKLKALKGVEGNQFSDDAYIYILHDILSGNNEDTSSSEEDFVDNTRNERTSDRIKHILENLLRRSDVVRKPRSSKGSRLRSGDLAKVRTLPPPHHQYDDEKDIK